MTLADSFIWGLVVGAAIFGSFAWVLRGQDWGGGQVDRHKGYLAGSERQAVMSKRAIRKTARYIRPGLEVKRAHPSEYSILLGFRKGIGPQDAPYREVRWNLEDSHIVIAPPGEGKTIHLKETLKDWAGPAIATSTKVDIVDHVARHRRRARGPIAIFNPEGLGTRGRRGAQYRSNIKWDVLSACKTKQGAIDIAGYLLSGTAAGGASGEGGDRKFWDDQANKVLRAYLFAAANAGETIATVKRWANKPNDRTAVHLLVAAGDSELNGWAEELGQVLDSYDRFKQSVFFTLAKIFDFFETPGVSDIVTLGESDRNFDPEQFLRRNGTLFAIGAHRDHASVAPLFNALTGLLYDTAKRLAQESANGRLDPPLLFALDEAPNVVPLPLHRMTAEARGLGMTFIVCIQTRDQLNDVWGSTRGNIIWSNCKVKMFGPSIHDDKTLDTVSKLCGTYNVTRETTTVGRDGSTTSSKVTEEKSVMTADDIRRLPDFTWLVLAGNQKPIKVVVSPFWERRSVRRAEAKLAKQSTSAAPPTPPAPRPPTRGGTPVVDDGPVAQILELPRHTEHSADSEESSG